MMDSEKVVYVVQGLAGSRNEFWVDKREFLTYDESVVEINRRLNIVPDAALRITRRIISDFVVFEVGVDV